MMKGRKFVVISDDEDEIVDLGKIPLRGRDNGDEDNEDDNESQDEYEDDGFIVDNVEEEKKKKKKKEEKKKKMRRKKRVSEQNYELDDEDYELIKESSFSVPHSELDGKKFKRLETSRKDTEELPYWITDEDSSRSGKVGRTAHKKMKYSLFGDDDDDKVDEEVKQEEEDEMADFIVDDEVDENDTRGQFKRPKRISHYSICSKSGLWKIASKLGYSYEQFGLHLSLVEMRLELEDAKESPEEMASNYTSMAFETPKAVLEEARHMKAVDISCETWVRKHFRGVFMDNDVVSTTPTAGNVPIDSFH